MAKKIIVHPGELFCIPLFMPKDDWKLTHKLLKDDLDKDFAFGRVIETSSSVLVEIFNKIGSSNVPIEDIIDSGIMFSPIQIFWDGIVKKRWKVIGFTENYDKFIHSNYENLKMVFPDSDDNFRLRILATGVETKISRKEIEKNNLEGSAVWWPIDLENRIIEKINRK